MASIHKTRYGTYELVWYENGDRKTTTCKTKAEANVMRGDIERKGRHVRRQDAPTLRQFAVEWLAGRTDLADATLALYAQQLKVHVLSDLGHLSVAELKPSRLAEWQRARLAAGSGPSALGKAQGVLSQILDSAVLPHEYLDVNPCLALKPPSYQKKEHRWLTAGDVEALRLWFIDREDLGSATLISVLAYVGIRPQDALARTWADLGDRLSVTSKVVNGEIKDGSKTGTAYKRRVEIPEMVAADLEEWRLASRGAGLIFPRKSDGLPWTKTDWDNWRSRHPKEGKRPRCFKRAAEDLGLGSSLKPYDLRHTAASLMAAAGWSAVEIAAQLGHSPTESQRTYQHLIHDDRRDRGSIDDYIREARGLAPERSEVRA